MSREYVLEKVRAALGRSSGQQVEPAPPPYLRIEDGTLEERAGRFAACLEKLAGRTHRASSPAEAGVLVNTLLNGRTAVASNAPFLAECGLTKVASTFSEREPLRAACASAEVGITSADYALAETGTLVMLSGPQEARLVSLLPPAHIAVFPIERLLSNLDELLTILPRPAEQTSSMVFITGPSRTADIEQILVRGVHGPGEIHVVIVERTISE